MKIDSRLQDRIDAFGGWIAREGHRRVNRGGERPGRA